jgi:hypothetical protein
MRMMTASMRPPWKPARSHRGEPDAERDAAAVDDPAQDVAPEVIGP